MSLDIWKRQAHAQIRKDPPDICSGHEQSTFSVPNGIVQGLAYIALLLLVEIA